MPESIRVEQLSKLYRSRDGTEVEALRDVSFTVGGGEFVSILGQSGCKSSLLKILAGLLFKTSGVISIEDRELDGRRSDIGLMPLYGLVILAEKLMLPWSRQESVG
jgi:NitT/TauT family transport system ATP-binding protein